MFKLKIWCDNDEEKNATVDGLMRALNGHMQHSITVMTEEPIVVLTVGGPCENPDDDYSLKVV